MKRQPLVGPALAMVATIALSGVALGFSGPSNGSFESGSYTPGASGFQLLSAGATNIDDWTIVAGSVDWIGTYWQAQDGSMSLDMSGNGPGTISTTFATTAGNWYSVASWLSGNPDGGAAVKTLTVDATGSPAESYEYDRSVHQNTRADMKWQEYGYSFQASAELTTLTFTSTTTGVFGPALDNVTVTKVQTVASGSACKDGGWREMTDDDGATFRNQGACVSHFATAGHTPIGPGEE